ncbi:MAG TPA: amidohydrolase family protein [Vicinamibacterales bacterium]|nr:amidohydrolase family protein [Vicinamibacterales bacterium]
MPFRPFDRRRPLTFVNARVLRPDGGFGRTLRIARGVVVQLDGDPASHDAVIDLDDAVVLPGLINAHDHLELNVFPRLRWRERYTNVREWIADFQPRFATDPALSAARPETLNDRLLVGALKNLLSGVTTVCHHNPVYRPMCRRFPVRIVRKFGFSHSLQIDGPRARASYEQTPRGWPWIIHAAEGTDEEAARELPRLSSWGCVGPNTTLVHGVAIDAGSRRLAIEAGASLVWCPGSNAFLFGATADVVDFSRVGRLAIGTDSRLSGEADLLEELRAARRTGQLDLPCLVRAVTADAAAVLRLPQAGRLLPGAPADLTIVAPIRRDPFESLLAARRTDIRLTMIGGAPMVADPALLPVFAAARTKARHVRLDGCPRVLADPVVARVAALGVTEPGLEVPS